MLARQSMPLQPASMGMTVIITSIMQVNFVMRWGNFGILCNRRGVYFVMFGTPKLWRCVIRDDHVIATAGKRIL
jgi:hypothetical protein